LAALSILDQAQICAFTREENNISEQKLDETSVTNLLSMGHIITILSMESK
jgi:hypothetical protein